MEELSIELIRREFENFKFQYNSYIITYQEFIKYFEEIDIIEKHHLIISCHFVYGWMPTILSLNDSDLTQVLELLNQAKKGRLLSLDELSILKKYINNSLVGLSKLLHFIHPEIYAMWDSRIFRFLTGKNSTYGIGRPSAYLEYLQGIRSIIEQKEFDQYYQKIQKKFPYSISKMRAVEIVIFQSKQRLNRIEVPN